MQFGLTDTQQMLKNSARRFFPAEFPAAEVRRLMESETAYDEKLWREMAAQGWMGITFGEEYGGMGLGFVEMALAAEEMGRSLVPGPYLSTVLLAGSLLDAAGNQAQKDKYLSAICRGEARSTVALGDSDGIQCSADGRSLPSASPQSSYTLTGKKLFVPDAGVADFLICACRSGSDLVLAIIDRKAKGLSVKMQPAIDLTRRIYEVTFDGVEVAPDDVLAVGGKAKTALERTLAIATTGLVAEMVGGMQKMLEITVEYAKTRKQFGKPIGQYQAVQHHCADMFLLTESSRSAVYYAAWCLNENAPETQAAVSIAKAYASDAYRECGNKAIQVHGGMGFTWENDLHLYYRRAKASEIAFGDATYHREHLAKIVIDGKRAATAGKQ